MTRISPTKPDVAGNPAFLRQRMFIVVREPYRVIGNSNLNVGGDSLNLKMPLKSARLTTLVTPNLDLPELGKCAVVATVGVTTAFFAATVALVQFFVLDRKAHY